MTKLHKDMCILLPPSLIIISRAKAFSGSYAEWKETWAGLFKAGFAGLRKPRVSVNADFRSDSFKKKFSRILFVRV